MKQDNRGFTLVELIVCIVIFSIVMLAAFGFMTAGSRSFTTVNTRIDRQLKAQLALNHVADTLMNGCTGVYASGSTLYVLTDNNGTPGYSVSVYGLSSGSLKYVRKSYSAAPTANTADGVTTLTYSVVGAAVKDLVASGVETFSVTLNPVEAGKPTLASAVVKLKLKNDTKTYTQTVALRNKPQLVSVKTS